MPEEFYTPAAARKVLGIPRHQLKMLVDTGKLERVLPETSTKRGVYRKQQVDALAEKLRNMIILRA